MEIMLFFDTLNQWDMELKKMNRGKEGHRFVYLESFMEALGCCHLYMHLPFRQIEDLIKSPPKRKNENYNVLNHLKKSKQATPQDTSETGRKYCHCNRYF